MDRAEMALEWLHDNGFKAAIYTGTKKTVVRVWPEDTPSSSEPFAHVEGEPEAGFAQVLVDAAEQVVKAKRAGIE